MLVSVCVIPVRVSDITASTIHRLTWLQSLNKVSHRHVYPTRRLVSYFSDLLNLELAPYETSSSSAPRFTLSLPLDQDPPVFLLARS